MWGGIILCISVLVWIASSTIDDHLFLTSRLTALYFGFPFLKSSSSCRLGLNSTLFVSLSHYYNLEDTLSSGLLYKVGSSGLLYKNPTQLFDQLLLFPSFNVNRCDTPCILFVLLLHTVWIRLPPSLLSAR